MLLPIREETVSLGKMVQRVKGTILERVKVKNETRTKYYVVCHARHT